MTDATSDASDAGGALAAFHDIVVPDPVSLAPATTAWLVLAVAIALGLIALAVLAALRFRRRRYRRVALGRLEGRARDDRTRPPRLAPPPPAPDPRVARAAPLPRASARGARPVLRGDRPRLASLAEDEWLGVIDASVGGHEFTEGPGRVLPDLAYSPTTAERLSVDEARALVALIGRWVRHHQWRRGEGPR